jgi:phage baseplate assembly protein W
MARELQAPFGLTPSGAIAVASIPGDQVQQHLTCLVSTAPGERVMRPTYGVPLAGDVFGLSADQVGPLVASDVRQAIQQWEPNVNLLNVQIMPSDTSEGLVAVDVQYSPGAVATASSVTSTATVLVGGTVVGS